MRKFSLSRGLVVVGLCAFSSLCLAQGGANRGGRTGQEQGQAAVDEFGRPLTGQIGQGLEPFDSVLSPLLQKYDIAGCVVSVLDNDKPVMTRGYGWANREAKVPMSPDSLFRIGALSKPITSAAILLLVQDGKLTLDTPVFDVLKGLAPLDGGTPDARLGKITIRHLLQHSGGWDAGASFDPFDKLGQIATAAKQPAPPDSDAIIRYMMGQPLQFDPGTKAVYSNFGYLLLGRVIEKISGIGYEDFVNAKLLNPIGTQTFRLGATRAQERDASEVKYYDFKGAPSATSLFDGNLAARPDGSLGLESRGASDGWVCSAPDYLRFLSAVDAVPDVPDVLSPDAVIEMVRRPDYGLKDATYYGLGWRVSPTRPYDPKYPNSNHKGEVYGNWWAEGALPGTSSFAARDASGHAVVVLFNSHPQDEKSWSNDLATAIDTALTQSQWTNQNGQNPDGNAEAR